MLNLIRLALSPPGGLEKIKKVPPVGHGSEAPVDWFSNFHKQIMPFSPSPKRAGRSVLCHGRSDLCHGRSDLSVSSINAMPTARSGLTTQLVLRGNPLAALSPMLQY